MQNLYSGCSFTDLWVSPTNWKTISGKKALEANWYVQCYFHDPKFKKKYPKGFPFRKKLNKLKTVEQRRAAVELFLKSIPSLLIDKGWNPITRTYMIEEPKEETPDEVLELLPETPFIDAIGLAYGKLNLGERTMSDLDYILIHIKRAITEIDIAKKKIVEVKRRDIKLIIEHLEKTDGEFSSHKYNKYISNLSYIFSELVEWECIDTNITRDIKKRVVEENQREVLNYEDRKKVVNHLKLQCPEFYVFTQIFFHSGIRITELLSIKVSDVDIDNQKFKYLLKKGGRHIWKDGVIKDIALPFWRKVLLVSSPNDFVFAKGLVPGEEQLTYSAIRLRWKRNVKIKLGITADFYSLKHLNLDETTNLLSLKDAAAMANHTTTKMVEKVYAIGERDRQNERLKKVANEL